jgi:hypothetical protein
MARKTYARQPASGDKSIDFQSQAIDLGLLKVNYFFQHFMLVATALQNR